MKEKLKEIEEKLGGELAKDLQVLADAICVVNHRHLPNEYKIQHAVNRRSGKEGDPETGGTACNEHVALAMEILVEMFRIIGLDNVPTQEEVIN